MTQLKKVNPFDGYDGMMDEECIELCNTLNSLPGVQTFESCCGHCKRKYMIFFTCNNPYSLAVIARAFNRRYSCTELEWVIELDTADSIINNFRYNYYLHSKTIYPSKRLMMEDVQTLIGNIHYWKMDKFKPHFLCEVDQ